MDPELVTILEAAPEFASRYLDLVEAVDGDPGTPAVFAELAELAAELVMRVEVHAPALIRLLAAIEDVASRSDEAEELVGWSFLDALSPDDLRRLEPWFGPATRAVLDELDLPVATGVEGRAEGRP